MADNTKTCSKCCNVKPVDEYRKHSRVCKPCRKAARRERYLANPKERIEGCIKRAAYVKNNPRKVALSYKKNKFGITPERYEELELSQGRSCAICKKDVNKVGSKNNLLSVDHDHRTGKVRGLLCNKCNSMIGLVKEDPKILVSAIDYLGKKANESL